MITRKLPHQSKAPFLLIGFTFLIFTLNNIMIYLVYAQKTSFKCGCQNLFTKAVDEPKRFFSVVFKDTTKLDYVVCMTRLAPNLAILEEQKVKLKYIRLNKTIDTIVEIKNLMYAIEYDIGGSGEPIVLPIRPARECVYVPDKTKDGYLGYLEFFTLSGYAGKDKSTRVVDGRKIGFNNLYFSTEFGFFPFENILGEYLNFGLGTGLILENTRLRIPIKGEIDVDFYSQKKQTTEFIEIKYQISDSCKFSREKNPNISLTCNHKQKELTRYSDYDDSVYIYPQIFEKSKGILFPYIFFEGGLIFNLKFSGSDLTTNILNEENRTQFFVGTGFGLRFWDFLIVRLGYRFVKFNIASYCPGCDDARVINSNLVNSITLSVGMKFNFK